MKIELRTKWRTLRSKWSGLSCVEKLGFELKINIILLVSFRFDLRKTDARAFSTSWAFVKIQMREMNQTDIAFIDGSGLVGTDRALPSLTLRLGL